jgi:hypothetical protein
MAVISLKAQEAFKRELLTCGPNSSFDQNQNILRSGSHGTVDISRNNSSHSLTDHHREPPEPPLNAVWL